MVKHVEASTNILFGTIRTSISPKVNMLREPESFESNEIQCFAVGQTIFVFKKEGLLTVCGFISHLVSYSFIHSKGYSYFNLVVEIYFFKWLKLWA